MSNSCDPVDFARQAPLFIDFPGKNNGVGCHFLLQEIFLTPGLNAHLLLGRHALHYFSGLPEKSMCVCRRYQHTGSLEVCRACTGELKEPGAENRTGAPDLSSAHSGAEPPAWSRMGQPEVPLVERGTTTHSLSLVWLPCVFPELSISPEAFLSCPRQWDPSAPHSGALGPAHLFPLTSSHNCFASVSSPFLKM